MAKEPDPPTGLPAEARRRGGMDTLFSAAWFDDKEGDDGDKPAAPVRRPAPAGPKPGPDPLLIAVGVLAGLGAVGFASVSLAMTAVVAYLWTLSA
jgi:hypothetical protein